MNSHPDLTLWLAPLVLAACTERETHPIVPSARLDSGSLDAGAADAPVDAAAEAAPDATDGCSPGQTFDAYVERAPPTTVYWKPSPATLVVPKLGVRVVVYENCQWGCSQWTWAADKIRFHADYNDPVSAADAHDTWVTVQQKGDRIVADWATVWPQGSRGPSYRSVELARLPCAGTVTFGKAPSP